VRRYQRRVWLATVLGSVHALVPAWATAQTVNLTVSATVQSSISLTFENEAAGVSLTGAGTSAATLAFGNVSAYGTISTSGVTRTLGASDFTVGSPFGANVSKANTSSASYTLQVALASADTTNTWKVNATSLTTSNQTLGSAYAYGGAIAHAVYLTVPFSAAAGAVSRTLNFTATAN
jgi:hypothetical protein